VKMSNEKKEYGVGRKFMSIPEKELKIVKTAPDIKTRPLKAEIKRVPEKFNRGAVRPWKPKGRKR